MIKKIGYEDKVAIQNDESVAEINKVTDTDMNEIKQVINNNADELKQAQENIQNSTESIEQLKEKDTTQDELIEQLQAENTKLKKEINSMQIPGEATGNPIHLTDSSDLECEIVPIGGAEQETREGYNLGKYNVGTKTVNGVTFTHNEDDSMTINGTPIGYIWFDMSDGVLLKAGTYTFAIEYYNLASGDDQVQVINKTLDKTIKSLYATDTVQSNKKVVEFALEEDAVCMLRYYCRQDDTINNQKLYAMILNGSYTVDTLPAFEPYGAMPSPGSPSPVKTVGQNVNLFDKDNANILNGYVINGQEVISADANARTLYIPCDANTDYTISKLASRLNVGYSVDIPTLGGTVCNVVNVGNTATKTTYKTGDDAKYLVVFYHSMAVTSPTEQEVLDSIKIEKGSKATAYSPYGQGSAEIKVDNGLETTDANYQSYTKVLPIQEEMLEGDYIEDVEHHGWGKYEITGNEDWKKSGNPNNISYYLIINSILVNIDGNTFSPSSSESETKVAIVLSNHFKAISPNQLFEGSENGICLNWVGGEKQMRLGFGLDSDINTVDKLKAWLKSLYDAGTPVIVYYKLATPKALELTEEQKAILNSFYTYKGITNISVDGIGTLKVNYKKDLETIINNLSATSVAE